MNNILQKINKHISKFVSEHIGCDRNTLYGGITDEVINTAIEENKPIENILGAIFLQYPLFVEHFYDYINESGIPLADRYNKQKKEHDERVKAIKDRNEIRRIFEKHHVELDGKWYPKNLCKHIHEGYGCAAVDYWKLKDKSTVLNFVEPPIDMEYEYIMRSSNWDY